MADDEPVRPDAGSPSVTRILAIMGSGETAPAMAKVHRMLVARLGETSRPAVVLDTPYGFQENADAIGARTVEFFASSVGRAVSMVTYRSADIDDASRTLAATRLREASFVMAGPGSPSYVVRTWHGGPVPAVLADKLANGGIVVLASAAALALGALTIPVYEIYKVGVAPAWISGLDLLEPSTGLSAAVVPHYDNAEGGNHDTRFCYMGERRLRILEGTLPAGTFILGIDGHTALVLDLEDRTATVHGLGGVTVRVDGRSTTFASGTSIAIDDLAAAARRLAAGRPGGAGGLNAGAPDGTDPATGAGSRGVDPFVGIAPSADRGPLAGTLRDAAVELEELFLAALDDRDVPTAVRTLLELDSALAARLRSGEDSPELDAASVTFRSLIVRLGEVADGGADPRATLDPFVSTLLDIRARARAARDWETADLVRARLTGAGVEVRDDQDASSWILRERVAS